MHRCTECGKTSHRECSPMVPHFCGLAPEMADTLVAAFEEHERKMHQREMEEAEKARRMAMGSDASAASSASIGTPSPASTMAEQAPEVPIRPPPRAQSIPQVNPDHCSSFQKSSSLQFPRLIDSQYRLLVHLPFLHHHRIRQSRFRRYHRHHRIFIMMVRPRSQVREWKYGLGPSPLCIRKR